MKKLTSKIVIVLVVVIMTAVGFIVGLHFNNKSQAISTNKAQNSQSSVTSTTVSSTVSQSSITQESSSQDDIATIYKDTSPAVVEINVTRYQGPYFPEATGQGSGFLIDANGDIVTNNHVVEGATSVQIVLKNWTTVNAKIMGTDSADDLAVVKVDAATVAGITPLTFDDSNNVEPGQTVIAIGSPYGYLNSVTAGIISSVNRQISETDTYSGTYINLTGTLQTNAAINPGNSGGPLLDTDGKVIGINTEIQNSSDGGIAFSVPSNVIEKALPNLIDGVTAGATS